MRIKNKTNSFMSYPSDSIPSIIKLTVQPRYKGISVLIVDSDITQSAKVAERLDTLSFRVSAKLNLGEVSISDLDRYDIILLDVNAIEKGHESWKKLRLRADSLSGCVIFLADHDSLADVGSSLEISACDLLLKPFTPEQVVDSVKHCATTLINKRANIAQRRDLKRYYSDNIVGDSEATEKLILTIRQLAPSRATVLVEGESGTGKELVARALHIQSGRAGSFIPVNCSASEEQLSRDFFSERDNVFELAKGGTLFLDQVSELPASIQGALLRIIDEESVRIGESNQCSSLDIRIVAATSKDLIAEVSNLRFRGDLYYRLSVLFISLIPLRDRMADLKPLVNYFTEKLLEENETKTPFNWNEDDIEAMYHYNWPGNVRELRNIIERCILVGKPHSQYWKELNLDSSRSSTQYLSFAATNESEANAVPDFCQETANGYPLEWTLKEVEKAHILQVVHYFDGNKSAAAKQLGVARKTLERKFKAWFGE